LYIYNIKIIIKNNKEEYLRRLVEVSWMEMPLVMTSSRMSTFSSFLNTPSTRLLVP
jgi:L-rhamnose mutarotase